MAHFEAFYPSVYRPIDDFSFDPYKPIPRDPNYLREGPTQHKDFRTTPMPHNVFLPDKLPHLRGFLRHRGYQNELHSSQRRQRRPLSGSANVPAWRHWRPSARVRRSFGSSEPIWLSVYPDTYYRGGPERFLSASVRHLGYENLSPKATPDFGNYINDPSLKNRRAWGTTQGLRPTITRPEQWPAHNSPHPWSGGRGQRSSASTSARFPDLRDVGPDPLSERLYRQFLHGLTGEPFVSSHRRPRSDCQPSLNNRITSSDAHRRNWAYGSIGGYAGTSVQTTIGDSSSYQSFDEGQNDEEEVTYSIRVILARLVKLQTMCDHLRSEQRDTRRQLRKATVQMKSILSLLRGDPAGRRAGSQRRRSSFAFNSKDFPFDHCRVFEPECLFSGPQNPPRERNDVEQSGEDDGRGRQPLTEFKAYLDNYNAAWEQLRDTNISDPNQIPWPTSDLNVQGLSQWADIMEQMPTSLFELRKWNTFRFFAQGCGLQPEPRFGDALRLSINTRALHQDLQSFRRQMQIEKRKFHPDKWSTAPEGVKDLFQSEEAKAVWAAINDSDALVRQLLR